MSLVGPAMLGLFDAAGVAVVDSRGVHVFGNAPPMPEIAAVDRWLLDQGGNQVLASERLAQDSGLSLDPELAAGVLMVPARAARGDERGQRFYWFRPEQPRTVHWAGDPTKPMGVDSDTGILSPRRSFALWAKTTRGCSDPWNELDLMGARMLRLILMRGGGRAD